jgi:hypothetical protein
MCFEFYDPVFVIYDDENSTYMGHKPCYCSSKFNSTASDHLKVVINGPRIFLIVWIEVKFGNKKQ